MHEALPPSRPVVALDLSGCGRSRVTGWERYALMLAAAVHAEAPAQETEGIGAAPALSVVDVAGGVRAGKIGHQIAAVRWFSNGAHRAVHQAGAGVYHALTLPPGRVPTGTKVVWTVHDDMALGGHPEFASRGTSLWAPIARLRLGGIDCFLTSTEAVAEELEARGVPRSKVRIMRPAADKLEAAAMCPTLRDGQGRVVEIPERFALMVGTIQTRKRVELACELARQCGLVPVVVGRLDDVTAQSLGAGVLFTGPASDGELVWCYQHAAVLISASRYEGINLPIFEARRYGLPVVASDIPVHRELAGEGIALFDPERLTSGIDAVRESVAQGRDGGSGLLASWEESAREHLELYRELLDS